MTSSPRTAPASSPCRSPAPPRSKVASTVYDYRPWDPVSHGLFFAVAQNPGFYFLWPLPKSYGHVFAIDEDGRVVEDLQDPSGAYPQTTGVTETADRLYIQSLHAHAIGWLPR
jgi:hypothetical protein